MQYAPQNGVYVYFRYDDKQTVMVIVNVTERERTVDTKRFDERTNGFSKGKDIVTATTNDLNAEWKIPPKTIWIMELQK